MFNNTKRSAKQVATRIYMFFWPVTNLTGHAGGCLPFKQRRKNLITHINQVSFFLIVCQCSIIRSLNATLSHIQPISIAFSHPMDSSLPPLVLLSKKIDGLSYSTCPTMDLVALTSDNGKKLSLYRKTGDRVWDTDIQDGLIKSVVWKPDGKQIALITSKNQCLIYDTNTSQILSTLQGAKDEDFSIGGWFVSEIQSSGNFKKCSLDFDIIKSLPKLPPLPSQSSNWGMAATATTSPEHKFATKQALESMIHNSIEDDLDLLFLFSDSKVNIVLHELFSLGSVDLIPNNIEDEEIVNYITTDNKDHYFITSSFVTMKYKIRRFRASFIDDYEHLQEITTSSSKIIALQGYIDEVLTHCLHDIKNYLDFNSRFIGILKNEIETKSTTPGDELYNLLLTGMMEDEVKDWLENTIGERGVKRWIKASEISFDGTRRSMIYHLVPACERILLLLGKLGGSAKAYGMLHNDEFQLSNLQEAKESVKDLIKMIFDFIQKINKEQSLFNAFISWIQVCLSDLQDEKPRVSYVTSVVSQFLNTYFEKSGLLMVIPFLKRSTNSIKINTNELFSTMKDKIRKTVVIDDNFELCMGMVTESQQIAQIGKFLYVITFHDIVLEIHQLNLETLELRNISLTMSSQIQEIKISQNKILLLSNHELYQIDISDLSFDDPSQDISALDFIHQTFNGIEEGNGEFFKPGHLTLNENFLCLISCDKEAYLAIDSDKSFR